VVLLDSHVRLGAATVNYRECFKALIRSLRHAELGNALKGA